MVCLKVSLSQYVAKELCFLLSYSLSKLLSSFIFFSIYSLLFLPVDLFSSAFSKTIFCSFKSWYFLSPQGPHLTAINTFQTKVLTKSFLALRLMCLFNNRSFRFWKVCLAIPLLILILTLFLCQEGIISSVYHTNQIGQSLTCFLVVFPVLIFYSFHLPSCLWPWVLPYLCLSLA